MLLSAVLKSHSPFFCLIPSGMASCMLSVYTSAFFIIFSIVLELKPSVAA